jgi:hypothetical protein
MGKRNRQQRRAEARASAAKPPARRAEAAAPASGAKGQAPAAKGPAKPAEAAAAPGKRAERPRPDGSAAPPSKDVAAADLARSVAYRKKSEWWLDRRVREARSAGLSWAAIGGILGVTGEAARKAYGSSDGSVRVLKRHANRHVQPSPTVTEGNP